MLARALEALGQPYDAIGRDGRARSDGVTSRSATSRVGVFFFSRVTKRQPWADSRAHQAKS